MASSPINEFARGPVSRVLSVALLSKRDCAAVPLGDGLPRPSSNQPGQRAGTRPICRPYSVLHPVGFTVPALLPGPRCALAAPFRPYPSEDLESEDWAVRFLWHCP